MEFNPKSFESIINDLKDLPEEEPIEYEFDEFLRRRIDDI